MTDGGTSGKPEVAAEETHYGPVLDNLVEQSRRDQRKPGVNADYDLVREHFDQHHYLLQAEGSGLAAEGDAIRHFLWRRAVAESSPHPSFSMRRYLERHPEHDPANGEQPERSPYLEWLKRGKAAGEIADPSDGIDAWAGMLRRTPQEVVEEVVEIRDDMLERLRHGELGRVYARAAQVEPLIAETWSETTRMRVLPLRGDFVANAVAAIDATQTAAGHRRARVLVVTDAAGSDRAPFVGAMVAALLGDLGDPGRLDADDVVVLHTDPAMRGGAEVPSTLPAGVRSVDFAAAGRVRPEYLEQALVALVRSFCADVVVCVDSVLLLSSLPVFGKALAASERLVLAFPEESAPMLGGSPVFHLRWFYGLVDEVEAVVVGGPEMKAELVEHFVLLPEDADRIEVWDVPGVAAGPAETERFAGQVRARLLRAERGDA